MPLDLTRLAVAAALMLGAVPASAQDVPPDVPPCHSRSVNVEHAHALKSDTAAGLLCLQGSRKALYLEVRQATVAAVLSALSTAYKISYRSSVALTETRDGVYAGSLGQVISRLLSDYDYVIKPEKSTFDVSIFDEKGGQAVPAPIAAEYGDTPVRPAARSSRTH
jgi:hypothetical protein